MRLHDILRRAMEEGIQFKVLNFPEGPGVAIQLNQDLAHQGITHIVETVIDQIFLPCCDDRDLQPVAYGVCATIISLALDLQLRSAMLLLQARLAIRGIEHE